MTNGTNMRGAQSSLSPRLPTVALAEEGGEPACSSSLSLGVEDRQAGVRVRGPSPQSSPSGRGISERWQSLLRQHLATAKRPILVILGPTASGKTAFSLEMAKWIEKFPLPSEGRGQGEGCMEIINADSRQLYKYMDIGTAKRPSPQSSPHGRGRVRIPHHLFSVLDPKEKVTVGWYKKEAERVIDDVLSRGSVPILVGGSMLYISAVTDGYVFTGRGGKRVAPVPYDTLIFGMQWPRGELVKRIEERTKKLLGLPPSPAAAGEGTGERDTWLQEVSWLLAHGYKTSDPGMESCGYREIAEWIRSGKKEELFPSIMERINAATRQYAKRQMTWWRHDKRIHWISFSL
ncbi:tRNA dimethylallyltransferase [Candidatus Peregrinibacteria bacterium]|nr:tRNA dimethylallyltransferase [Candidatus Peregrinibacteria bacterium]